MASPARTHVALLRGVNVGGHNKVPMADLRRIVAGLGHAEVATYLNSGNVAFASAEAEPAAVSGALERGLAAELGVRVKVVTLTAAQLARVAADNPFPEESNPKALHAVFAAEEPSAELRRQVDAAVRAARERGSRDDARIVGRTLYLRTPDGLGRSDLAAALTKASTAGTARNWATVRALLDLTGQGAG